jgi:hypothetical protein
MLSRNPLKYKTVHPGMPFDDMGFFVINLSGRLFTPASCGAT